MRFGVAGVQLVVLAAVVDAWDYSENGADWARNSVGLCGAGAGAGGGGAELHAKQSPIDLPLGGAEDTGLRRVFLKYPPLEMELDVYNNGHAIAFTLPEAYKGGFGFVSSSEELHGAQAAVFRAWQVSFHSPSEHTLAGRRLPLEMQMVHQRVTGKNELAVVSVLFEEGPGDPSPFLDALLAHGLPSAAWDDVSVSFARARESSSSIPGSSDASSVGFEALLRGSAFYAYEGSLTVPPCETGVKHFVRQEAVVASLGQLKQFSDVLLGLCPPRGNYRSPLATSTAGLSVVVVGSVDTIGGVEASATAGVAEAEAAARLPGGTPGVSPQDRAMVENSQEFKELQPDDSEALKQAKIHYHEAMLRREATKLAEARANQAVRDAQAAQAAAQGPLGKSTMQSRVLAAQQAHVPLLTNFTAAVREADEALRELLRVYRSDSASVDDSGVGIAATKTTTVAPTEYGSLKVATTEAPFVVGVDSLNAEVEPGSLEYPEPTVALPRGLAASPFAPQHAAQTEVSVGTSAGQAVVGPASAHGAMRLAPNLRQPDGPEGTVPLPTLAGSSAGAALSELASSVRGARPDPASNRRAAEPLVQPDRPQPPPRARRKQQQQKQQHLRAPELAG